MMVRTAAHFCMCELTVVAEDRETLVQVRRDGVQYKITFTYLADIKLCARKRRLFS